jgi:hypothetical protein
VTNEDSNGRAKGFSKLEELCTILSENERKQESRISMLFSGFQNHDVIPEMQ